MIAKGSLSGSNMPIGTELLRTFQLEESMTLGESLEEAKEELEKHDFQFHHFSKKGTFFHLDQHVEDHLQKEKYFQKNEEDYCCRNLTSIIAEKKIPVS